MIVGAIVGAPLGDVVAITLQAHNGSWGCQPPRWRNIGKETVEESDGGTVGRCTTGEGRLDYLQVVLEKEKRRAGTSRRRPKNGRRGARGQTLLPEVCAVNCLVSQCPVCFCAWGAAVCPCAAEGGRLPTPRVTTAVASPRTLFPTSARLCTERSRGYPPSSVYSWMIHAQGSVVKLTPGLILSGLRPLGPRRPSEDSTSVRKESKM